MKSILSAPLAIIAAVTLAITLVGAGLLLCCVRPVTGILSNQTSNAELSPYTAESLTDLALATRDYTIDDTDVSLISATIAMASLDEDEEDKRADAIELIEAADTLVQASRLSDSSSDSASLSSIVSDFFSSLTSSNSYSINISELSSSSTSSSDLVSYLTTLTSIEESAGEDIERYTLDQEAIEHLYDVHDLISATKNALGSTVIIALIALLALCLLGARRIAGLVCIITPAAIVILFAILGVCAFINFSGFFEFFHSLFFPAGTWSFAEESLLICMYPMAFWTSMGIIWLVGTLLLCMASIYVGGKLYRTKKALTKKS